MESYEGLLSIGMLFAIIYFILVLLIPVFLYLIQKWAYKSYLELREINLQLLNLPKLTTHTQIIAKYYSPKILKKKEP